MFMLYSLSLPRPFSSEKAILDWNSFLNSVATVENVNAFKSCLDLF